MGAQVKAAAKRQRFGWGGSRFVSKLPDGSLDLFESMAPPHFPASGTNLSTLPLIQ